MNTGEVFFQIGYFLSDNCKTASKAKENNIKCYCTLHGWLWVNHFTSCLMCPVRAPAHILPCRDRRKQCLGAGSPRAGAVGEMKLLWDAGSLGSLSYSNICFLRMSVHLSLHYLVSQLLSLLTQSSETGVILTTTHQAGLHQWAPVLIPGRALMKPEVTCRCQQSKHLCCLLGHHLPGNQVPVKANSSIFIIFKMELGAFGAVSPSSWPC